MIELRNPFSFLQRAEAKRRNEDRQAEVDRLSWGAIESALNMPGVVTEGQITVSVLMDTLNVQLERQEESINSLVQKGSLMDAIIKILSVNLPGYLGNSETVDAAPLLAAIDARKQATNSVVSSTQS